MIVEVPEGVIKIGNGAFTECSSLSSISLPNTLTYLGESAFELCQRLTSITIPELVTQINDRTFLNCSELREAILHDKIKTIGYASFCSTAFESISLPRNLELIGREAFNGVRNLKYLVIPNSVKKIDWLAFDQLRNINSIVLPAGLTRMDDLTHDSPNLEKFAIPKSVTSIKSGINFEGCHKVEIWGFKGSTAETFAKKNNIPFVAVDPVQEVNILLDGADVTKGKLSIDLNTEITTLQYTSQTSPENPWPGVTWKSSDAKIASVDFNGLVTGLKKGKVTITATAVDGSGKKATCEITVAHLAKEIVITGEATLKAGKKTTLKAAILPDVTDSKKIDWTTSDKAVATVDAGGVVTAKKITEEKTVTITATAKDGSGVFAEFQITIVP